MRAFAFGNVFLSSLTHTDPTLDLCPGGYLWPSLEYLHYLPFPLFFWPCLDLIPARIPNRLLFSSVSFVPFPFHSLNLPTFAYVRTGLFSSASQTSDLSR